MASSRGQGLDRPIVSITNPFEPNQFSMWEHPLYIWMSPKMRGRVAMAEGDIYGDFKEKGSSGYIGHRTAPSATIYTFIKIRQ